MKSGPFKLGLGVGLRARGFVRRTFAIAMLTLRVCGIFHNWDQLIITCVTGTTLLPDNTGSQYNGAETL
jgi:hypothetical protein